MDRCYICGKKETEFDENNKWTEEHIIPFAIGNTKLKTMRICKKCNSKMGDHIDNKFINCFFVQCARNIYNLKGRNSLISDPFEVITDSQTGYTYKKQTDGKYVSDDKLIKDGKTIKAHSSSKARLKKMIEKSLGRTGTSKEIIQIALDHIEEIEPTKISEFETEIKIDLHDLNNTINFELLKIAYEYCVECFGETFFNDSDVQKIRNLLYNAIYNDTYDYCEVNRLVNPYPSNLEKCISPLKEKEHIINVCNDRANKLICHIYLLNDPLFSRSVLLTKNGLSFEKGDENMPFDDIPFCPLDN